MVTTGARPIGPVDAIWLNMDRPNNLMVIDALLWLHEPITRARLGEVVRQRLVERYPVFRQRPVPGGAPSASGWTRRHWEEDPEFALDRHVRRARLRPPGDDAALHHFVDARLSRPFDRRHPLWEIHLIDGYGSGAVVLARMHHALADGVALAQVLLSLTDASVGSDGGVADPPRPAAPARGPADTVAAGISLVRRYATPRGLVEVLALARQAGGVVGKLVLGSNPATPLSGRPGVAKHAVWSAPRPLQPVKTLGKMTGATVNDVLVCAVAGGLSRYLAEHGSPPVDLTTMVPVNLRPQGVPLPAELGNRFALVLLELPSGRWPVLARLAETKRRMDAIKHSPEAAITFGLISAIGRATPYVDQPLVDFFSSKAFGVTTNVAGPTTERSLAGSQVDSVLGWVPGSGDQGVGVSIVTYNGTVRLGFKVDAVIVPDPDRLVAAAEASLDELLRITRNA
ncbi:MAG TPA: wax ester/triacylglycerol synthase family O-acyltransferase [Actinomycetes bacterium]|nr:wax ester/triacylglycerol synthase family O-acyltransferase [Actinomycetes bacterium]